MSVFFLLSFLLFLVLFGLSFVSTGGLFTLDFVMAPFTHFQAWYSQSIVWHSLDMMNFIFGNEIASKLCFLWVFLLGMYASYQIGKAIISLFHSEKNEQIIIFCTSLLFLMLNPFTYERMITQFGIIGGTFCLAIGVAFLFRFICEKKEKLVGFASVWFGFAIVFFPHSSLFIALIGIIFLILFFNIFPKKYLLIGPLILLLVNANWLIGDIFFDNANAPTKSIATFDAGNIEGFLGNSLSGLGVEITHLLLYGFWGERFHILTPEKFNPHWYIFGFIIFGIIIYGCRKVYKKDKKIFWFLSLICVVSYVLALGVSSKIFGGITEFLYLRIPLYMGMREPQKWLGLTMIVFTSYFVVGVYFLSKKYFLKYVHYSLVLLMCISLINAWNPLNLWSYQGQLLGIRYPSSFSDTKNRLGTHVKKEGKVLIFPWHSYMACEWTRGKILADTSGKFLYPIQTITADNIELNTKYSNSSSPVSKDIDTFLKSKDGSLLQKNNISYIVFLSRCADYNNYDFLEKEVYLKKVKEFETLKVYEIR